MAGKRRRDATLDEEKPADTTHPARRRRVEYTETDAKLAAFYNDLSDDVKSVRLRAAADLIRTLSDAEPEKLDRALTRLIKGLCSSRKAARSGFSVALTEVLRLTPKHAKPTSGGFDLSLPSLIDRVLSITAPDVRSNSQERRDYLLGRCFGFKSVIQSQLLFSNGVPITEWEKILDLIFQLASETVWLRRECGMTLYETVSSLAQVEGIDSQYANLLLSKLHEHRLTKTPEGLAIWLTASKVLPGVSLPKGVWDHNDPLSSKERTVIAKVLRDNQSEEDSGSSRATGAAERSPSFAWQVVLSHLYERHQPSKKDQEKSSSFEKFWIEAVDNGLFASTASTERKALGLQVVILGIVTAPVDLLSSVFSPNVMRCIINQRGDAARYLHEAAKAPLLQVVVRGRSEQEAIPPMLKALLSDRGSVDFDKLTKTKTVEELVKRAKNDSADECLRTIQQLIAQPGTDEPQQAGNRRRMLADMLLSMIRSKQPEESVDTAPASKKERQDTTPWLGLLLGMVDFGYGGPSAGKFQASPPLSDATQEVFRARLMSGLSHVMSTRMDEQFKVPEALVNAVRVSDKTSFSGLRTKADKQVLKIVEGAHGTISDIHRMEKKKKDKSIAALRAFKALFALSVLQAYNGEADVIGVLEDLDMAYQSWQKNTDSSIMLIEILLSFISKPSNVYRTLAQQVFGAFSSQLNEDGLQSLLDILEKKESLSGQQELFENADEAEEDVGAEGIDGQDDSDVEMIEGGDDSDVEIEEGDDSDDGDEDEDEDEDEDDNSGDEAADEEAADFERKLAEALRTSKAGPDPHEGGSDDDSDMDDEQMMALDGHLTTIFKERSKISNKKKDNKDAKENIVNFKNRVLDLLLIFAKQEHTNALTLDLILPLLSLIRTTSSKQISEKAFNLLQQYIGVCNKGKEYPVPDEVKDALGLIKAVHTEMRSNASKVHSNACSRSSLFLAKILLNIDSKHYAEIADLYSELQKEWYADPKSHIQASVFTEWTSWTIATRKHQH